MQIKRNEDGTYTLHCNEAELFTIDRSLQINRQDIILRSRGYTIKGKADQKMLRLSNDMSGEIAKVYYAKIDCLYSDSAPK